MKKLICVICVLVLSALGSIEAYASYNAEIYDQNEGIYGENGKKTNEGENARSVTSPDDGKEEPKRVLLVGNSFTRHTISPGITYSIDRCMEELAAGDGHNLEVTTLAHGSAKLSDYAGIVDQNISYYGELDRKSVV